MKLRSTRLILLVFFIPVILILSACSSMRKVEDPNLIVIIIDTLRQDHLGCYGYTGVKTDNIDRIAREGLLFTDAVCQVPITFPSHCSIFTGRYPTAHGARHNGLFKLGQDETTLAEILRQNGFETAAFVASYVLNSGFGLEQGFHTYNDIKINLKQAKEQRSVQDVRAPERVAEEVNAEFFKWLDTVKNKRFFAWVHYYDPHHPYSPPADTSKKIEGKGYDAEVSYSDQCIGDLMNKLRESGCLDNSIVLFASDHGEALGEHGESAHGIFIYDCTVKIPVILRAPWIVSGGSRFTGLFESIDIVPTLLGLLKIEIPPSVQGKNFAGEIEGKEYKKGKAESYAETYMPTFEYGWSELKSIRRGDKKFIEAPIPEFYDLTSDPSELSNIFNQSDQECVEMKEGLAGMLAKISTGGADPYAMNQLDEENIRVLKSLGYLSGDYFKGGQIEAGRIRLDPKVTIEEENIITNGKNLMGEGRLDEALDAFSKVLQKNPKNYQARVFTVKVLVAKKDYANAMREAKAAVKIAEIDRTALVALGAELWNIYGFLLERENDSEGAIKAYEKGFEINPDNEIAFTFPANFHIAKKDFDKALGFVNRAFEENKDNVLANVYLFKIYVEKKMLEQAAGVAKKLAHFDLSDDPQTLGFVARMLYNRKIYTEAALAYEQMLRMNPKDKDAAGMLGNIYFAAGEARLARKTFEHILTLDQQEFRAHYFIGIIDLEKDDEAAARKRFKQVLSMNPAFYQVYDALGSWLKDKGRTAEAREEFKKALTLNPDDKIALKQLENIR